jgi:hypothetical protein
VPNHSCELCQWHKAHLITRRLHTSCLLFIPCFEPNSRLSVSSAHAPPQRAVQGVDKYVKKRKLDPLAAYIPAILVAQSQLLDVPSAAEVVSLDAARALLRQGAFNGLRDNVRAVSEYAARDIGTEAAKARATAFFKALENVDSALFLVGAPCPGAADVTKERCAGSRVLLLLRLKRSC